MPRLTAILLAGACLAALAAAPAMAEESCTNTAAMMSRAAITKSLEDRGFTKIRGLSTHNGCWEAKGFDSKGKRFELELNGASGAVINKE